ncbi:hypothetical protein G647_06453 [Cladophialophora carrionii CBS 160.54]|uniref:EGF-like domain-containing protein n=1 Tax=Cladophialophora carrionii CBS 160.54 TaxID=1279043 RepID=V9D664_9EURO|nr:uncharacterized protein G647_06453 [Cladophialophora carrionii CBS 160.54]ETI22379.1 hypothetical protein G647_06453 [Cladophialophora carrionii CBS 160.54]
MDASRPKTSQSAENRFHYSKPNYAQPSQYQQFPPHPSVRVPPNVKLSARQVPAGVGVAPPPVRYGSPARPIQPQRTTGNGMLVQEFKFPAAPPIPASSSSRSRQEPWQQSPGRKYNGHESYLSSVVNDFTPETTPGSRSRGFPTPTSKRYSGSVYAESEALGLEERFGSEARGLDSDESYSPDPTQQIVRQASLGKRAKPAITTIRNRESQMEPNIPENFPAPPTHVSRKATMEALSAAVAAGMSSAPHIGSRSGTPVSRGHTPVRMPFDTSPPPSPSADREFLQTPKSPNTIVSGKMLGQTPGSVHSQRSTNPLLGLGIEQPSMSDKIPASRRPPRLDMDAVREAESRGSTTSLADLIKRATRLAANLDRGKTASRLGMLDMFGSSEKLGVGVGGATNRHSTMSDMLSAFPAPAIGGTPTKRDTAWPLGEKSDAYASTTDLSRGQPAKQRRKCCGLSLPVFIIVIIASIVLIAAAVLIPIFLILVPNQHKNSNELSNCASNHPCGNGGTSIVSNNACVCVCSNGFTGSQCETSGNTDDCMTITLNDGNIEYKNATIGSSILPSLTDTQIRFDIPLNVSTILSIFSFNNLSCTSENSMVDFNSSALNQGANAKRFVVVPGFEPQPPAINRLPQPPQITARAESDCSKEHLERRQEGESAGTTTSNGIVFAQSSPTIGAIEPTTPVATGVSAVASVDETSTPTASATSSTSQGNSAPTTVAQSPTVSDKELEFAKLVVLYVLQESQAVSVAVNAQQRMELFFTSQTSDNTTSPKVDVGMGNLVLTADFDKFSITKGDGEVIGGDEGSGSR